MLKERSWPSAICHTRELATEEGIFTIWSTTEEEMKINKTK